MKFLAFFPVALKGRENGIFLFLPCKYTVKNRSPCGEHKLHRKGIFIVLRYAFSCKSRSSAASRTAQRSTSAAWSSSGKVGKLGARRMFSSAGSTP